MGGVLLSLGPKATGCFAFGGLKRLLCMLSVFHSVLISGPARTVQFNGESFSSLGKEMVKIFVWLPV